MRLRSSLILLAALTVALSPASAQLRGGGPVRARGLPSWWISGGAVVPGIGTVSDGVTGSTWGFSGDPRWQLRGTLEKTFQPTTTIGLGVSYGNVDFDYRPLAGVTLPQGPADEAPSVSACRSAGCTGQMELWAVQAVLRGGGSGEGLYQIVEATGGVLGFRKMLVKSDGEPLPPEDAYDINVGLGYGFGFALDTDLHIAFVQDFGIAWHRRDGLPDGVGRTYRVRNSRITLRYGLGNFGR